MDEQREGKPAGAMIEAAWTIVERDGADGLTLRKLAAAVGVSHPDTYQHFSARQAVLAELASAGFFRLATAMAQAAATADDARGQLRATLGAYMQFAVANPAVFRLMFGDTDGVPHATDGANTFAALHHAIEAGQAAGVFRQGDPQGLTTIAWSLIHGLATLWVDRQLDDDTADAAALTDLAYDVLYRGLSG